MSLMQVKIKNFRSIGRLELFFVKGVNLISGFNGSGKTNIAQSLLFAIFGKVPVGRANKRLSNERLSYRGNRPFVAINHSDFKIDSELNGEIDGNQLKGEPDERRSTWFSWLGTDSLSQKELFRQITSNVYVHAHSESVAELGKAERTDYLMSLFGVGFIDTLTDNLKNTKQELLQEVSSLDTFLSGVAHIEEQNEEAIKKRLGELDFGDFDPTELAQVKVRIDILTKETENLRAAKFPVRDHYTKDDLEDYYKRKFSELESKMPDVDTEFDQEKLDGISDSLVATNQKLAKLIDRRDDLSRQQDSALVCPACEAQLQYVRPDLFIFDLETLSGELTKSAEEIKMLEATKERFEEEQLEQNQAKLKKDILKQINSLKDERTERLSKLDEQKAQLEEDKRKWQSDINNKISENETEVRNLNDSIPELEAKDIIYREHQDLIAKLGEINKLRPLIEKKKESQKRLDELNSKFSDVSFLLKTGIPTLKQRLINQYSQVFENEINKVLEALGADGIIEFKPIFSKSTGDLKEIALRQFNNGEWSDYDSLNNGEKKLITIACMFARINAHPSELDKLGILIFDDLVGELDAEREEALGKYLKSLDKYVIVTTCKPANWLNPDKTTEVELANGETIRLHESTHDTKL